MRSYESNNWILFLPLPLHSSPVLSLQNNYSNGALSQQKFAQPEPERKRNNWIKKRTEPERKLQWPANSLVAFLRDVIPLTCGRRSQNA
ncbi:hypothetical protein CEXT_222461 [Caerostris extrusa]|uniref:Uncharacterized protein n=1 Tax=Caerostris extrusa TaxID=172846 RepID=A0AAV4NYZ4_CAEEX|nr:hypothetical protein CEXT_222461 [Caerostris extrusa]